MSLSHIANLGVNQVFTFTALQSTGIILSHLCQMTLNSVSTLAGLIRRTGHTEGDFEPTGANREVDPKTDRKGVKNHVIELGA